MTITTTRRFHHQRIAAGWLMALGLAVLVLTASLARADTSTSLPPGPVTAADVNYRIGPLDKLNVAVFGVKELSIDKIQVDASGQMLMPLIGMIAAKGKTPMELSSEIAARLSEHYLQSPQVSVTVDEAVSLKISVEGAVTEAGVFELKGRTSLLEAVAKAKGAAKNANLHRVTIIRKVDGAPHAATFDLVSISAGRAGNPEVFGNDVVIVDFSKAKTFWRGMIEFLPALFVFTYL